MITVGFAIAAELLAVSVRMLVDDTGFGANEAVSPLDKPDAVRITLPLYPANGVIEIVDCREAPWTSTPEYTEELMVKVGARIVKAKLVLTVNVPLVPVMVMLYVPGATEP
jgi:hypothetical protein